MSEDESEFIVVDEASSFETKETINRLKEVVEMYKGSYDALTKSNILLQDQLHLALQLVLQRVPSDYEINKDGILGLVSGSMTTGSDTVRREYVTKLCSKLVAVNDNYEKIVKEFEEFKLTNPHLSSLETKLDRLTEILKNVEGVLPATENPNSISFYDQIFSQALNSTEDKIDSLCDLAEAINLRVRALLDSPCTNTKQSSIELDASCLPYSDLVRANIEEETVDKQCETSSDLIEKIVSEKINEILKKENLLSQQVNIIKSSLESSNNPEAVDLLTPTMCTLDNLKLSSTSASPLTITPSHLESDCPPTTERASVNQQTAYSNQSHISTHLESNCLQPQSYTPDQETDYSNQSHMSTHLESNCLQPQSYTPDQRGRTFRGRWTQGRRRNARSHEDWQNYIPVGVRDLLFSSGAVPFNRRPW